MVFLMMIILHYCCLGESPLPFYIIVVSSLQHVQRPLLSFGPKSSMKLSTCPVNVCKELRLSSHLISEFSSESSGMTIDGAYSTAWLRNLQKPIGSLAEVLMFPNSVPNQPQFPDLCCKYWVRLIYFVRLRRSYMAGSCCGTLPLLHVLQIQSAS